MTNSGADYKWTQIKLNPGLNAALYMIILIILEESAILIIITLFVRTSVLQLVWFLNTLFLIFKWKVSIK